MTAANPEAVSPTATKRGLAQVGTLGSRNHFLEVDRVAEVSHQLGIATKVARLLPMAVIKG
ncbi:hypothetical protein AC480_04750 [miscellaneous Crenarchaeota group archaeon SMTZ1-55]|nr:MAG: hypothetical protein AC480_04750 [miscellaneous Crenarchaeota group archaeon SMTZ1-55]